MSVELVKLINVSKCFPLSPGSRLWNSSSNQSDLVLNNISLNIRSGEAIGLMGVNGSGKSTLLQIIAGTMQPSFGSIQRCGGICSLLELGSGLHPDFDAIENIKLYGALLSLKRNDLNSYIDGVLKFSEIPTEAIKKPVRTYSSGMMLRLAFACLTEKMPKLLVVDEALAVGDVSFQAKCYNRIDSYKSKGMSLLLVSHDPHSISTNTTYSYLLSHGRIIFEGVSREVSNKYLEISTTTRIKKENPNNLNLKSFCDSYSSTEGYLSSENRWGDYRAKITAFKVSVNEKGKHKVKYRSGEKLNIQFMFLCNEKISKLVPGILLKTKEGIYLFGTNSINVDGKVINASPKECYTVSFEFDVNINSGEYLISLGLSSVENSEFIAVDKRYDSILLEIESAKKDAGILSLNSNYSQKRC
jgi:lipopolysaccharide transport system ATP-binding protein